MALRKILEEMEIVVGFEGLGSPFTTPMDIELMEEDGDAYIKAPRDALFDKQTLSWMTKELDLFQHQIDAGKPQDPLPTTVREYSFVEAIQLMEINRGLVVQCIETQEKYYIDQENKFICLRTKDNSFESVGTMYNYTFIKV